MVSFIANTYALTWELYWSSWQKDWKRQQKTTSQLESYFHKDLPLVPNLMWNIIMFALVEMVTIHYAGFSKDFELFCLYTVVLPSIVGSISYYSFKFGARQVVTSLSPATFFQWCHNWLVMQGISLVGLTQIVLLYFAAIPLQAILLPKSWNFSIAFSTELYEESFRFCVYWYVFQLTICVLAIPAWKQAYELSMEVAGRPNNVTMSYLEIFMEILYQTGQSGTIIFGHTPLLVLLMNNFGFRVYVMHIVFATLEILLLNYAVQYKFCIMHKLMHSIRPLYNMAHIEHHICKGVYPTTTGVGLWEFWCSGQSNMLCTPFGMAPIPYLSLQSVFMGVNLVVHTMWPARCLLQWHTLHHVVLADIYNLNVPSPYDKQKSKSFSELHSKLSSMSPFIRYEALSDVTGFALFVFVSAVVHFGFDAGMFQADWVKHTDLQYAAPLSMALW
ncbi:hypothetical protein ACHAWF_006236 [Thalassiosira exigua]